jgi:predicted dehydrogenase
MSSILSTEPFVLRWGIAGAGAISTKFVTDILLDPITRNVTDIKHKLAAVGSRDILRGQEFVKKLTGGDDSVKVYGSYQELCNDPDIDAIYIGTPHTHHYAVVLLALNASKHVLCEKPFTSNAAELKALVKLAKEKKRFLMEAMWTRFQPIAIEIKKVIDEGSLGDIRVLHADLSGDFDVDNIPDTHRILDPRLGGGALLDLGPYPLVWAIIAMYEHKANERSPPSKVVGSMIKSPRTGVDSTTTFVLSFDKIHGQAILSCGITMSSPMPAITIRFRNGNIIVDGKIYRPTSFTVQYFDKPGSSVVVREEKKEFSHVGGGWHYQADEVARCIRDGKLESELWSLDKSILAMEVFDQVRQQNGYAFPEGVEQVV